MSYLVEARADHKPAIVESFHRFQTVLCINERGNSMGSSDDYVKLSDAFVFSGLH